MRVVVQLGVVALAVGLGVGVGQRLSAEAMAVVVGVVCGVLASIPTSVMVLVAARRFVSPHRSREAAAAAPAMNYPPVVVIQADGRGFDNRLAPPVWDAPPAAENQPWRRSFTVVGDDDSW